MMIIKIETIYIYIEMKQNYRCTVYTLSILNEYMLKFVRDNIIYLNPFVILINIYRYYSRCLSL